MLVVCFPSSQAESWLGVIIGESVSRRAASSAQTCSRVMVLLRRARRSGDSVFDAVAVMRQANALHGGRSVGLSFARPGVRVEELSSCPASRQTAGHIHPRPTAAERRRFPT